MRAGERVAEESRAARAAEEAGEGAVRYELWRYLRVVVNLHQLRAQLQVQLAQQQAQAKALARGARRRYCLLHRSSWAAALGWTCSVAEGVEQKVGRDRANGHSSMNCIENHVGRWEEPV